jgi:hypothetical protein
MCLSYFGLENGAFHAVTGALLLAVLALKIVVCAGGTPPAASCPCGDQRLHSPRRHLAEHRGRVPG